MKTTLDFDIDAPRLAGEGWVVTAATVPQAVWPLIARAFDAAFGVHTRAGFGGEGGRGSFAWSEADAVAGSERRFRWRIEQAPPPLWRILLATLEVRGVERLALRGMPAAGAWVEPDALLRPRVGRPSSCPFELSVIEHPKELLDRFVHLRFQRAIDDDAVPQVLESLSNWHELLWHGFATDRTAGAPFPCASAYLMDPCSIVSRVAFWSASDEAWAVLLRLARSIDKRLCPLRSVTIE